jgi:hypothetical protein
MAAGIVLAIVLILTAVLYTCRRKSRNARLKNSRNRPIPLQLLASPSTQPRRPDPHPNWALRTPGKGRLNDYRLRSPSLASPITSSSPRSPVSPLTPTYRMGDTEGVRTRIETMRRSVGTEEFSARTAYYTSAVDHGDRAADQGENLVDGSTGHSAECNAKSSEVDWSEETDSRIRIRQQHGGSKNMDMNNLFGSFADDSDQMQVPQLQISGTAYTSKRWSGYPSSIQ